MIRQSTDGTVMAKLQMQLANQGALASIAEFPMTLSGVQAVTEVTGLSLGAPKVDFNSPEAQPLPEPFCFDDRYERRFGLWPRFQAWLISFIAGDRSVILNVDISVGSRVYLMNTPVQSFLHVKPIKD